MCKCIDIPTFCPVETIKQGLEESLGWDMHDAYSDEEELPEIDLRLPASLKKLEELIKLMTSFYPDDRPVSMDVKSQLTALHSEV